MATATAAAKRMFIDGQFPSWGLDTADPLGAAQALLDQFMDAIEINPA